MRTNDIITLLTRRIEHDQWPHDGRLPPLRALSAEIDTSLPTLRKALATLQRSGLLEPLPEGNRYFVKGFAPGKDSAPGNQARRTRHERIAIDLRDRLARGVYGPGLFLPGLKELRRDFACSHVTIRRALDVLENRWGMVSENKGRYVRTPAQVMPHGATSVYLAGSPALMESYREQFFQLVNSLERRLREVGWGQLRWFLNDDPQQASAPPDHEVSAYIHVLHGPTRGWGTFFGTKRRIPVVYIDFDEIERGRFRQHRLFVKIRPDNVRAGVQIGRHLQELGHSRVAFISQLTTERNLWLSNRRKGLAEILGECSRTGDPGVVDFVFDYAAGSLPQQPQTAGHIRALRSEFTDCGAIPPGVVALKFKGVYDLEYYRRLAAIMQPAFEQALDDTTVTAWVCANDDLALVAQAFLSRRGCRVPDHLSVVGFDNTQGSFAQEITTFDPGIDAIAAMAVQAISSPRSVIRDPRNIVALPGQLVVRKSTAAARHGRPRV